jgi:uncharacterized protein (DUF1778 family)
MAERKIKKDWRSLPRKAAAAKRSERLAVKLTPAEAEALRRNAAAAGLGITDYIASRCAK